MPEMTEARTGETPTLESLFSLEGRVAVVTGACGLIGREHCRALLGAGATVVAVDLSQERLDDLTGLLGEELADRDGDGASTARRAIGVATDITDPASIERLRDRLLGELGAIDILVNNAGYGLFKPVVEMTAEEFDDLLRVNLHGVFLATKYVLPHMYERRSGMVITVSSIAGKNGFAGGGGYAASKFGVMGLMESVFHEARGHDVRVVTLCPGSVNTHFFDEAHMSPPNRDSILQSEDVAATILFAAKLPEHALIRELDLRPTNPRRD